MRKIFIISFFALFGLLQFGCRGTSGDTNQANSNGETPLNTNSNTVAQSTPLPDFADADTAYAEGNKLFDANKTELAIEAYRQAVEKNPDFADAWFKLGVSYALLEKQNEIESLNEEVEVTPTPTPSKKSKNSKKEEVIRTKDSEKAFEKAVAAYKKIIAKNDKDDAAYYNLGRSYNKLDEDEDAAKALKEAVKLKPEETLYQTEYGAILIKLAQYDEAVRALKKALELDPEYSAAAELLEKAEAGKKRIDFGVTPKPPQQENTPKTGKTVNPEGTASPTPEEKPDTQGKPTETKPTKTPEKKPEKKLDKKGDQ
jgi:tetratricopeptide (TPR) repeat protein